MKPQVMQGSFYVIDVGEAREVLLPNEIPTKPVKIGDLTRYLVGKPVRAKSPVDECLKSGWVAFLAEADGTRTTITFHYSERRAWKYIMDTYGSNGFAWEKEVQKRIDQLPRAMGER